MPAFVILVILGVILLWFLMSFAFVPFGKFVYGLWKDARDAMDSDEDPEEEYEEFRK